MEGVSVIDWSNVTIAATLTNMNVFWSYYNGTKSLTSVTFGANCDFSGVTTWERAFENQSLLTNLDFDSGVSFASTTNMISMLYNCNVDTADYDALLIRIDATNTRNSVTLTANLSNYTLGGAAEASRTQLVTNQFWTITDAGGV